MADEMTPTKTEVNEVAKAVVEAATDKPELKKETKKIRYQASVYPAKRDLPEQFGRAVRQLESTLSCPVWVLIQNEKQGHPFAEIDTAVYNGLFRERDAIERNAPVALLIDSPGGRASFAYKIARLFQRRAGEFYVVVPKWAKSAATLMTLGATKVIMGEDAELGPLDVQMLDLEREEYGSALNAVQSLERINAFTMTTVDQLTPLLMKRTGRKLDMILPLVLKCTVDFVRPLLEKIDTVDYTKKARELKVAEEYAFRLMKINYDEEIANASLST